MKTSSCANRKKTLAGNAGSVKIMAQKGYVKRFQVINVPLAKVVSQAAPVLLVKRTSAKITKVAGIVIGAKTVNARRKQKLMCANHPKMQV